MKTAFGIGDTVRFRTDRPAMSGMRVTHIIPAGSHAGNGERNASRQTMYVCFNALCGINFLALEKELVRA